MKKFKCPNCKRETEVEGNMIMVICGCGYEMIEQVINHEEYKLEYVPTD